MVDNSVEKLRHIVYYDAQKVSDIHNLYTSRGKAVNLVQRIQQAIQAASTESLMQKAAVMMKDDNTQQSNPSFNHIDTLFEMSQQAIENDVLPLLQQFQTLLESSQTPQSNTNAQHAQHLLYDFSDPNTVQIDLAVENLFILAECTASIQSASNNAARSIQQLTQARNSFLN